MRRILLGLIILGVLFFLAPLISEAQPPCTVAQMISPTNNSTLPAGAVTFEWCNANADYFLTIESVPGAHDIFYALAGGTGPGAGVISVTIGPACLPSPPIGCIPPRGEAIYVTLDTIRNHAILGSFQYTYTAANSTPPGPIVTTTAADNASTTSSNVAQNITLSATVTAASTVNQGTVTFQVKDGANNIGSAVTSGTLTTGNASVIYVLPPGTTPKNYTIQAAYSGGSNFQASSGTGTLTVNAPPPTIIPTATTVDNKTATFNSTAQNVTLTATVAAASTVNQGTVTFQVMDGLSNIGSAVTSGALTTGSASVIYLLPAATAPKNYTIQASYSGGSNFQSSIGTGVLTVNATSPTQTPSTTTVDNKTATFSSMDQSVTLTATVAAASTVNQGTVAFQLMDGADSVGGVVTSGTLTNGSASVSYLLPAGMTPKNYTIKSAYSGGPDFQASTGTGTLGIAANPDFTMTLHLPMNGASATSSGSGALAVSYGQMNSSMTSNPVAIANFGYSSGGAGAALVTEAGVPAATVLTSARLFVDYTADTNSGFALVNPNSAPITIKADLKDARGITIATTNIPLGARSHTAMFVNQLLSTLSSPFLGTITLTSANGFAAVNLSTATSGRREMLFSALPVADLGNPPTGTQLILSQIVDGGGNPTQIMLMNPSGAAQSVGKVQLFDDGGAPLALDFGNPSGPQDTLNFTLAPDGMAKFATTGNGALRVGYAVVTVSSGALPVGNGIFQFREVAGLASQAGVPNSAQTTSARLYVEVASAPLKRNTGIAIVNGNATASTLTLTLKGFDGSSQVATLTVGPNGHSAKYVTQLFTGLPADFSGVLNISSTQPNSFLTLRQTINERGESIWSTLPVANLNSAPQGIQILPQIVNGGGYKTEIIVLSTSVDLGAVYVNFFDETGGNVPLALLL